MIDYDPAELVLVDYHREQAGIFNENVLLEAEARDDAAKKIDNEWKREAKQHAQMMVDASRNTIFGDTSAWGFHEIVESTIALPSFEDIEEHERLSAIAESEADRLAAAVPNGVLGATGRSHPDYPIDDLPEHHDPEDPDWGRHIGERWRRVIRDSLSAAERRDPVAVRSLVASFLEAERMLYDVSGLVQSGVFNGLAPLQRVELDVEMPVAIRPNKGTLWHPDDAYAGDLERMCIGVHQASLDAALSARTERLQEPRDPIDTVVDIVAGDYRERAIDRLIELATDQIAPWMSQRPPERRAVRSILASICDAAQLTGDEWRDSARLANLRALLTQMVDDDEMWKLLSRAGDRR